MIISEASEIEVMQCGLVYFSISGGRSMFELRHGQEIVIRVAPDGLLHAEVRKSAGVYVEKPNTTIQRPSGPLE
jgi:hypothetical protein